jgi:hypothetical protein
VKPLKTVCVIFALTVVPAHSQQTAGSIVGTLTDPSGALTPNVELTITNVNTNTVRNTVTDNSGNYTVPFLVAGSYRITAAAKGFRQKAIDNVVLQVGKPYGSICNSKWETRRKQSKCRRQLLLFKPRTQPSAL